MLKRGGGGLRRVLGNRKRVVGLEMGAGARKEVVEGQDVSW